MELKFKIRLFTLDDDETMHIIIKDALDHADIGGYEMFDHKDKFFDALDEFVHIAIIDHYLGGQITGLEVMEQLLDVNPYCYVIIISGMYDPDLVIKYQEAGSCIFIRKDNKNFTGKLMSYVNKAYRKIYSFLEFEARQIEAYRRLKPPCL